jgi:hypothetical protein
MNHAFKKAVAAPMRGQSQRRSAIEAAANVVIGYLVAVTANYFVLPAFGYMVTVQDSFYNWSGVHCDQHVAQLCSTSVVQ